MYVLRLGSLKGFPCIFDSGKWDIYKYKKYRVFLNIYVLNFH